MKCERCGHEEHDEDKCRGQHTERIGTMSESIGDCPCPEFRPVSGSDIVWVDEGDGYFHAHEHGQTCALDDQVCSVLALDEETQITINLPPMPATEAKRLAERLYEAARPVKADAERHRVSKADIDEMEAEAAPSEASAASRVIYVRCPFCGEDDFDLVGLKIHYQRGHCEPFNET